MTAVAVRKGGAGADEMAAIRVVMAAAAPLALAQMDPHSLSDLAVYMECLAKAKTDKDKKQIESIVTAIREVFQVPDTTEGPEVGELLESMKQTPSGNVAVEAVDAENAAFIERYTAAKNKAGINTQREVADRCGLSKTTVNAIETERVAPQCRTMEKLARGLGVSVEWLLYGRESK